MMFTKLSLLLAIVGLLVGCTSTYIAPSDSGTATAKLTVRSPAGRPVSAGIYQSKKDCRLKHANLKPSGSTPKAYKTYVLPAEQWLDLTFHLHGNNFHGFSCNSGASLKLDVDEHYVVTLIADSKKAICRNKLFKHSDPEHDLDIRTRMLTAEGTEATNTEVDASGCNANFEPKTLTGKNTFQSKIYHDRTNFSPYGPYQQSSEMQEK